MFAAIYRQIAGYINNIYLVIALKKDSQNIIFSLKNDIWGCQHGDQEIRK